jgi:hypothetical protein
MEFCCTTSNTFTITHKQWIRGGARARFAPSLDPPLEGMPIGFVKASKCQLECLLVVLTNQNSSWNAERHSRWRCYSSLVQDCHMGANTHTHTHILGVLAQHFVCESHAAVSNLPSCYPIGHLVPSGLCMGIGDTALGPLPNHAPADRALN